MELDETRTILNAGGFQQGKIISHYRLDQFLGAGGMGTVWKAEDVHLKRPVAIKAVSALAEASAEANLRFQIEAQAAAALDHPAICTIYEIDQHGGIWFLAMAYIEGENLSRKIRPGGLDIGFALEIAGEVADGLAAAHNRQIVHRDIKSSNIMVTPQNTARILDFGLARVGWTPGATLAGTVLGTPSYMSPEQVRGGRLDHRTDLWSLGVVLYEMLAGKLPFHGDYREALYRAIIESPPPGVRELRPDVPDELAQIVYKALAKSPADRYQTAAEMRDALYALGTGPSAASGSSDSGTVRRWHKPPSIPSIAVLPFVNLTSDPENEYFSDGLTDELITALAQIRGMRVVSRTSAFAMKGKTEDVRHIGVLLHAGSVLEGSVRKNRDRLRINVRLINADDGFPLWSDRYDERMDDIFQVQEDIAGKVVGALKLTLLDRGADLFAKRRPANMEAYKLYLQGQYFIHQLNPAVLAKARDCFEQALALEPEYAPAHAGLARYYTRAAFFNMGGAPLEVLPRAQDAATRALALDGQLAEACTTLGEVVLFLDWDWSGAERYFQEGIRLTPGDVTLRHPYAMLLMRQGRFDESWIQIKEALESDPVSMVLNNALGFLYFYARRYDDALLVSGKNLNMNPNFFETYANQGLTYSVLGRHEEAIAAMDQCRRLSRNHAQTAAFYAHVCGMAGRREEALKVIDELHGRAASEYVAPTGFAAAYIGVGDYDRGLEYLSTACDIHDPTVLFLGVLHAFDPARADPRFRELLARIGLPPTFHPSTLHMFSDTGLA